MKNINIVKLILVLATNKKVRKIVGLTVKCLLDDGKLDHFERSQIKHEIITAIEQSFK